MATCSSCSRSGNGSSIDDCDYADLGGDFFIRRDTDRARQRAVAQLQALGYHVTLQPAA